MLTFNGKQFICQNFGDSNFCCINTGLSWYYTKEGQDYQETGGTAQAVSRLASGLADSVTMTSPNQGTFTKAQLDTANGQTVTLDDCRIMAQHDESSEDQWCFIPCSAHIDKTSCLASGCNWYNGACYSEPPSCTEINNYTDCVAYNCHWYNNSCNANPPSCTDLNNEPDCTANNCYWYGNSCHSTDQNPICYWIDTKGGAITIALSDVFELIDAYLFQIPPSGFNFIPTLNELFGVIDYYLGFNGDGQTGCNYFG